MNRPGGKEDYVLKQTVIELKLRWLCSGLSALVQLLLATTAEPNFVTWYVREYEYVGGLPGHGGT